MSAGGRLRWRHVLTRDAVLAVRAAAGAGRARPPRRRPRWPAGRAGRRRAGRRAAHRGGGAGPGRRDLLRLARRDLSRGALRSALELLDRAAAAGVATAGPSRWSGSGCADLAGRSPGALEAGTAALAGVTGDEHAELCLQLARAAVAGGRWAAGRAVGRAGRPAGRPALARPRRGRRVRRRRTPSGRRLAARRGRRGRAGRAARGAVRGAGRGRAVRVLHRPRPRGAAFRRAAQVAAEHGLDRSAGRRAGRLRHGGAARPAPTAGAVDAARELALRRRHAGPAAVHRHGPPRPPVLAVDGPGRRRAVRAGGRRLTPGGCGFRPGRRMSETAWRPPGRRGRPRGDVRAARRGRRAGRHVRWRSPPWPHGRAALPHCWPATCPRRTPCSTRAWRGCWGTTRRRR